MKTILKKLLYPAALAADVCCLLYALAAEVIAAHVSDPFKYPKY